MGLQNPDSPSILLLDDDEVILEIFGALIRTEGYRVTSLNNSEHALKLLGSTDFNLIITDLGMPSVNGFDILYAAGQTCPDVPVIMLTGMGTIDNAMRAIELGAYDFVAKPVVDPAMLLSPIKRGLEKHFLLKEQRDYLAKIESQNRSMIKDLQVAKNIQQSMMNMSFSKADDCLEISYQYVPVKHVGGDFFNVIPLNDGKYLFYMADVAGHGVSAAMVSVFAQTAIPNMAQSPQASDSGDTVSPQHILSRLNVELNKLGFEKEGVPIYLTIILGIIDINQDLIKYANAGHLPAAKILKENKAIRDLAPTGGPMGLFEQAEIKESEETFSSSDTFFLFTDGLINTTGQGDEKFEEKRINTCLECFDESDTEKMSAEMLEQVVGFRGANIQEDDISIMVIGRKK